MGFNVINWMPLEEAREFNQAKSPERLRAGLLAAVEESSQALGRSMVQVRLDNMEKDKQIQMLGEQVMQLKLQLMQLSQGGEEV